MRKVWLGLLCAVAMISRAQTAAVVWQMQESGTTAGLRGIDSVDGTVAWASGTGGTVLRTVDGGAHWTKCAVPDGDKDGGTLDFRGVQAWDAKTAIVMASGPGEKSRLYKTVDGCGTWRLVFRNPDKGGFWDAIRITGQKTGLLTGDPVPAVHSHIKGGKKVFQFPIYATIDRAETWIRLETEYFLVFSDESGKPAETLFAASNSALLESAGHEWILFVTGGQQASLKLLEHISNPNPAICRSACWVTGGAKLNMSTGQSAGAFSLDARIAESSSPKLVIVGGDYAKPEVSEGTSTTCEKDPNMLLSTVFKCTISSVPPHGYRSTVQWSESLKVWITAGTNGSDVSRDDGRTWKALDDGNWNALSLPFVVGPGGRIGRLNEGALGKP